MSTKIYDLYPADQLDGEMLPGHADRERDIIAEESDGKYISNIVFARMEEGDIDKNRARVIACWRACEGIDDPQQLRAQRDGLLNVLAEALPYVEMAEHDELYKPGTVKKMVNKMRKAIAHATPEPASK